MNAGPEQEEQTPTYAVHEEGGQVLSLSLQPVTPERMLEALRDLGGELTSLGDGEYLLADRPLSEAEREALPGSVMVAPELLPDTARVAVHLNPDGHAVVYGRSREDLAHLLLPLFESLGDLTEPTPPQDGLLELIQPGDWDSWVELQRLEHARHKVLHLRVRTLGQTLHSTRWIAPAHGGEWRTGWSW
ncbi:MAG: hypothetical protein VX899_15395 [Myxococcota bacterium]|nr:hypothetical protein [Myxococcota bacterium]